MELTRQEIEKKTVEFFERATEENKVRIFQNLIFSLPYEELRQLFEAEVE